MRFRGANHFLNIFRYHGGIINLKLLLSGAFRRLGNFWTMVHWFTLFLYTMEICESQNIFFTCEPLLLLWTKFTQFFSKLWFMIHIFPYFHSSQKSREPVNHDSKIIQAPNNLGSWLTTNAIRPPCHVKIIF